MMKRITDYRMKRITIIALGLMAACAVRAQQLTIEQCRSLAAENNKSLASAQLQRGKTTFDMKSYKANFFPKLSVMAADIYSFADGSFTMQGGKLPIYTLSPETGAYVPDVTVKPDGSYVFNKYADFPSQQIDWKLRNFFTGGISLLQPVYAGGKISTAYRMSKIGVGMAEENVRLKESEVIVKTDEAYSLAVKAKEMKEVAQKYQATLLEVKKNVEAAFKHGLSTRNDIMKVQVKLNEAELSVQKADNAYRLALMNLCHVIGRPLDSAIEVVSPAQDAESLIAACDDDVQAAGGLGALSISSRPEYSIMNSKTELARQQVRLAKSEMLPNVAVGAAYLYMNGGEVAGSKLLDQASASVGITVNVPLDLFGSTSNKVRSARVAYQISQMEQQDACEQMTLEQASCRNTYDEAKTELRLCETALAQAAENMRLSRQQYDVGFETLSDYLETQTSWQQCNANLVSARQQLVLARTKLIKAMGGK